MGEERGEREEKKELGSESVSAQFTHCLMFCSSARSRESKSCTDSTSTLFDVEPRKQSGIVTRVYEEKHLEINEYARREKIK